MTPTVLPRSKLARMGNASGMPTRPVSSCGPGSPAHGVAAPRRLLPLAIADLAAAQLRTRRGDHRAGRVRHPDFLIEIEIALGFAEELLDAAVGVAGDGVVLKEAELRPPAQRLVAIEQQPLRASRS